MRESVASLHTDGAAVYDVRWCDPPHHLGRIWGRVRMRESVASLHLKATLPPADTPASEITVVYSILRVREIVLSHSYSGYQKKSESRPRCRINTPVQNKTSSEYHTERGVWRRGQV